MGFRFNKHINLGKHLRLNISKSGIGISGGIKGARISFNPKTGIRKSIGIPGTGIYYSEQHKIKKYSVKKNNIKKNNVINNKSTDISESDNLIDHNKIVLNIANKKLLKVCIKIFFVCAFLDVLFFKSNSVLLQFFLWVIIIGYVGTRISMNKKVKNCNKNNIMI